MCMKTNDRNTHDVVVKHQICVCLYVNKAAVLSLEENFALLKCSYINIILIEMLN